MVCDSCGSKGAVVHLTQVVNDKMTTMHLCEPCAAEKGLNSSFSSGNLPLADFLAKMGSDPTQLQDSEEDQTCQFCGLSGSEFKDVGRLGCPHCYATFEPSLRGLLRRIHGGTQHVGKVYLSPDPSSTEREKRLEALRRKLRHAIESEDFERAADLRDEIRSFEPVS
ncbi:UvrB/UvrC motif-containing protein [Gemmatimonadota bacterium]